MYASLISAGASQLSDLYESLTSRRISGAAGVDGAGASTGASPTATDAGPGPVNGTGQSGASVSDAVRKLLTDMQASASATTSSADATNTVASDLRSVFGAGKAGGHHGHGRPTASPQGGDTAVGATDPLQSLASSLVAYAKNAASASASTSLTA